jgi:hypothetical protein
VPLRPSAAAADEDEPGELVTTADTGTAEEKRIEGGMVLALRGCSARTAALEVQSVVPQAFSPVE